MATLRTLPLVALASALLFSAVSPAQQASPAARIVNPIDENQLVPLKGNINPHANAKNDRGPVSDSLPMADLTLLLSRTPEQQAAFDAYVQSEYDAGSPNFHHWLTPAQIGQLYGPAQSDIAAISAWLSSKGFSVTHVAQDRMSIGFSGTAGQVTGAFHTEIHQLLVNGESHIANMSDPQIPAAISPVVSGLKGLHNFLPRPLHHNGGLVHFNQQAGKWQLPAVASTKSASTNTASTDTSAGTTARLAPATRLHPQFGVNVPASDGDDAYLEEDVTPYDFATIYNVLPLWTASTPITGTGQTIAIVGTSDINVNGTTTASANNDVATYRAAFGLPAGLAVKEAKGVNGTDPGNCGNNADTDVCNAGDLEENTLDVEVSGGVAPGAQIVLVTSGYNSQTNPTNDPLYSDAQFVIENHNNTSTSATANELAVAGASILSVSYGECELGMGESSNVAYYNLWQSAAAEGIAVFVATGDSGSPSCDDGGDSDGVPYSAQYGLSVNGLASTPFNTAVGGTDFSWCKPVITDSNGDLGGCPTTSATASPYWNSTNNTTTGESAKGYVPETPWNDTCENPIWSAYLLSFANELIGAGLSSSSSPDAVCNWIENNWFTVYQDYESQEQIVLAAYIDTVGSSGGASNCVVNDTDSTSNSLGTCTTTANTVSTAGGTVNLVNDGWPSPSWQVSSGVTGTSSLTSRAIPDISFFAGDGSLDSATLICVSALGSCLTSSTVGTNPVTTEPYAQEVGGTSVATPEMAGVMALINQKSGAAQGLPNKQLYSLAASQNYSSCSAESVTNSSSCKFQSIDEGTNAMPCSLGTAGAEGGAEYEGSGEWEVPSQSYTGLVSPNCTALTSGDTIGTLVSSGTTPAYNATAGFNLATGLGSMNVANVVNAWVSDAGTATATLTIITTPAAGTSGSITLGSGVALVIDATVTGSDGAATGTISVTGPGFTGNATLSSGAATITIPAGTLTPGTDTVTVSYGGDSNYAEASQSLTVIVAASTATVTVTAQATGNTASSVPVSVSVTGPSTSAPAPTGTVTLTATGGYSSTAMTLSGSDTASFTIPAGSLPVGTDTITANYSGDTNYGSATGTATIVISSSATLTPTVSVATTPASSVDTAESLAVAITVSGSGGTPTGAVTLTSSAAVSGSTLASGLTAQLSAGVASITIPANSLSAGTDTLSVSYAGDGVYLPATGTASITVTQSTYTLSSTTPAAVSPGGTATSTISGVASTTGYVGVVTLSNCTVTTGPTNAVNIPTCTVSGTITYAGGSTDTPTGTGTATVTTYSNASAMLNTHPYKLLYGAGGTVLAFLVFLGIPARRKSWRALLGAIVLLAGLGTLSACGGGVTATSNATTPGSYTFQVTGTGNDANSTVETTTFTLTVN
jgi:subtilase family serine protease